MQLTLEQIKKLNTKRLLNHYRKERDKNSSGVKCDCCHEFYWDLHEEKEYYKNMKISYYNMLEYLSIVKNELNTREHLVRA